MFNDVLIFIRRAFVVFIGLGLCFSSLSQPSPLSEWVKPLSKINRKTPEFQAWMSFFKEHLSERKSTQILSTVLPSQKNLFVELYEYTSSTQLIKNLDFFGEYMASARLSRQSVEALWVAFFSDPRNILQIPEVSVAAPQSSVFKIMSFLQNYTGDRKAFAHFLKFSLKGDSRFSVLEIPFEVFKSNIQWAEATVGKTFVHPPARRQQKLPLPRIFKKQIKKKAKALLSHHLNEGLVNYELLLEDVKTSYRSVRASYLASQQEVAQKLEAVPLEGGAESFLHSTLLPRSQKELVNLKERQKNAPAFPCHKLF